jgi:uncharacterized protein (DUF2336 family)
MTSRYTEAELLDLARSDRWQGQVTVATRTNVTPEVLEALMVPGIHHEVAFALISRAGVTEEQLAWLAENTDSPHALGRIAGHPKPAQQLSRASVTTQQVRSGKAGAICTTTFQSC